MSEHWELILGVEKQKPYFQEILRYVDNERQNGKIIFPPSKEVFNAFRLTDFGQLSIVILGQDPYHGYGQAHGLAFSVKDGVVPPPSLRNIFKELSEDIEGFQIPKHGNLEQWAQQGVLLLNTVLTVEQGLAHSHANIGWETFTDVVIERINEHCESVVFLLWGAHAQKKGAKIDRQRHCVLTSVHPSPLSAYRGFLGCKHFSKANFYLQQHHRKPIDWQI